MPKKHGVGNVFAGHFRSIDYTGRPSKQGGPIVGAEINFKANGDDDAGLRVGLARILHQKKGKTPLVLYNSVI